MSAPYWHRDELRLPEGRVKVKLVKQGLKEGAVGLSIECPNEWLFLDPKSADEVGRALRKYAKKAQRARGE